LTPVLSAGVVGLTFAAIGVFCDGQLVCP